LRTLIGAILVYPGAKRGEVRVEMRGDLAAFLYLADRGALGDGTNSKTPATIGGNGRSEEVMGTLVAGAGFEPAAFRL
jgi:hypothetical protein